MSTSRMFHLPDGNYRFHFNRFRDAFRSYCLRSSITISKGELQLSDALHVSRSTVHGWRSSTYGPADLDVIRKLTDFFGIDDQKYFLQKTGGSTNMQEATSDRLPKTGAILTNRQLDALKRLYDAIILFLDEYAITDGFNDYWEVIKEKYGDDAPKHELELYQLVNDKLHRVEIVLQQEAFDLHSIDIEELEDLIYEYLPQLYHGQLNSEGRLNATIKEKAAEYIMGYSAAYEFAVDKLNAIIFRLQEGGSYE